MFSRRRQATNEVLFHLEVVDSDRPDCHDRLYEEAVAGS